MANPDHVEIAKRGAEAIAQWREQNPPPTRFDLSNAHLYEINLEGANLDGADLRGTFLVGANLRGASLNHAILQGVFLTQADLRGITFNTLLKNHCAGARLDGANLSGTNLSKKNLEGADLSGAILAGADLNRTRLAHTKMTGASLENADLRDVRDITLDQNAIRGARFSPYANDSWSVLRRHYTGTRLLFHLLLLFAFVLPLVVKTMFWVGIYHVEKRILDADKHSYSAAPSTDVPAQPTSSEEPPRVAVPTGLRQYQVWQLLIGVDRGYAAWPLTLVLLVYNICRGVLTGLVAPLRDEEERTGISPRLSGWRSTDGLNNLHHIVDGYGWLIWPHRVVRLLLWAALASFLWHAWYWLTIPVWIFSR